MGLASNHSQPRCVVALSSDGRANEKIEITVTPTGVIEKRTKVLYLVPWELASATERANPVGHKQEGELSQKEQRGFLYSIGITANKPNLMIAIPCMRSNEIQREASFCLQFGKSECRTLAQITFDVSWRHLIQ